MLAGVIGRAALHGDHVTPEILRETLRAETAALELRPDQWIIVDGCCRHRGGGWSTQADRLRMRFPPDAGPSQHPETL